MSCLDQRINLIFLIPWTQAIEFEVGVYDDDSLYCVFGTSFNLTRDKFDVRVFCQFHVFSPLRIIRGRQYRPLLPFGN